MTKQSLRVLVVEDNEDAARMLVAILRVYGHEVQAAHSGDAGLQAALTARPHLILMDIGLPRINGYDLARELRAKPEFASTTFIAMTGYCRDEDRKRAMDAGFDHFLLKPLDHSQLKELLGTLNFA